MADIQHKQEHQRALPIKNKPKKPSPTFKKFNRSYCPLCRISYFNHEGHDHMHSMLHHRELETVLGKDAFHDCQACKINDLGLNEYAEHISTTQHNVSLNNLKTKNIKPICLSKTVSLETMNIILKRNKTLKLQEKKVVKKNKKKEKQIAGQKNVANKKKKASKGKGKSKDKPQRTQTKTPKQWPQTPNQNNMVVQNKENKMFRVQSPAYYRGPPFHNPNWRPVFPPGVPGGWSFPPQFAQNPFNHPNLHPRFRPPFGNYQYNQSKFEHLQSNGHFENSYDHHVGAANMPKPDAGGQGNYYNMQHDESSHNVYSSQQVSDNGDVLFDQNQAEKMESSQPEGPGCSTQPASANKPTPIQDIDVTAVLKQIRRELGVREPCRADREARKQNTKAAVQANAGQPVTTLDVFPPHAPPVKPNKKSSASKDGDTNGRKEETLTVAFSEGASTSTATETNLSKSCKVRIAHRSAQGEKVTAHKPVLDKLLSLSGTRSKLNWREMYNTKKNQRDRLRFKTELAKHLTDKKSSVQDADLPLSEGFHWESISESLPVPPSNNGLPETQTVSQTHDSRKSPDAAQAACSRQPAQRVKVEPEAEDETNTRRRRSSNTADDRVSSAKKKKKSKKDQSQMDQLLAVSLREDELSCSLQDLDKSLIQARNALQAAYTEVQRLLLLRQQFTAEVNSLRTKRIEILQGMQDGYSEASSAAETSSSGVPPPSFLSSSAFSISPSLHPTSITQSPPGLPAVSVKQEVCLLSEQAAASTSDAPPVPLFPSDQLQPSHVATATASSATQPTAESSKSAKSPARESSSIKMEILERESQLSESESEENLTKGKRNGPAENKSAPEPKKTSSEESDSDSSVEMVNSSVLEVIDVEESDCESLVQPEDPQTSVSVDFTSASTQTSQESETEKKYQPAVLPKDTNSPPESVEDDSSFIGAFSSHDGPVHGLQVHNGLLYTCSGDNTAQAHSLVNRECKAVFQGHTKKINCLLVSSPLNSPARLYTGSSDQTIRCYSIKSKKCLEQITLPDRVLCLHIAWNILYAGLASGSVSSFDLKTLKDLDVFECHGPRGVSCLGTTQEGARRLLLVGSYDSTISVRDAKSGLLLRLLEGHTKTVLCMKVVNDLVFSGSSDTSVHAHNIHTGELVRIYKGHGHAVTSIVILGKVMVTACLDKLVRVYELQSHDRLQVYGGHSDMVMCMAVHKSVIYTGCYDGTIQAVKLNLMKNYRCWWQSCSLIFGVPEHLLQHLCQDHSNTNMQTVKCRWKNCNSFFAMQQAIKQELPDHMQNHIEDDSKLQP